MPKTIKKTSLAKLTYLYNGLSQAMRSFAGAVGYQERTRELQWVHSSRDELTEAVSHGIRQSATSVKMFEMAMSLISDADNLQVNLEQEAARSIKLMAKLEANGASVQRQEEAARDHQVLLAAITKSDTATEDHIQTIADMLSVPTPHTPQVYNFATRRRVA